MTITPSWTPALPLDEAVAKITTAITQVYGQYEEDMLRWLGHQLAAAETPEDLARFNQQMTTMAEEVDRARHLTDQLLDDTTTVAVDMVDTAAQYGIATALMQIESRGITPRTEPSVAPAVYSVLGDLGNSLDEAHRRILRIPQDMFQEINALGTAEGILHGQPLKQRHRRIWSRFVDQGINGFTDVSGRNWNLVSYVEMASRTTVARAYRAQTQHTLLENDLNLVTLATTSDACRVCSSWSGSVLSLDGTPPGFYPMWSALTGDTELVTVDATQEDAAADGLFHPNCQCTPVPYLPGDTPPQAVEYDEEEHQARESQRYHERQIRRLKRETLVDPEMTDYYQKRIRSHQAKIRGLVDDHGLNRKREREQINHGYRQHH